MFDRPLFSALFVVPLFIGCSSVAVEQADDARTPMAPAPSFDAPAIEKWLVAPGGYRLQVFFDGKVTFDVPLSVIDWVLEEIEKRAPGAVNRSRQGLVAFREESGNVDYVLYPLVEHECFLFEEVPCPAPGTPSGNLQYQAHDNPYVVLRVDSNGDVVSCEIEKEGKKSDC